MGKQSNTAKRLADSDREAPHYACRGWCRFNAATGAVIGTKGAGVLTDNGPGDFSITWSIPSLAYNGGIDGAFDQYATQVTIGRGSVSTLSDAIAYGNATVNPNQGTTTRVLLSQNATATDFTDVSVCIFR